MAFLKKEYLLVLLTGLSCVAGFAPFGLYPLPVAALALLFVLWGRALTPREAARLGFFFGLGLFGAGISWIYIALHDFGGMPLWLAAPAMLSFSAFLSLFPALAGYLQARVNVKFAQRTGMSEGGAEFVRPLLLMPAAWVLIEWLRGMIFTGFPWLTLGYAHSDSPLAGFAPLLGVYGVSLLAAFSAGLLAVLYRVRRWRWLTLLAALLVWGAGTLLRNVNWTQPLGAPFTVTLIQGNVGQDVKFDDEVLDSTLDMYRRQVMQNPARLTVLPETAFPVLREDVPESIAVQLRDHARRYEGDVLVGVFERDIKGYYNSVISLGASENGFAASQPRYRKHHLVIFGEFIPFRPLFGWLINEVLHIPMGDLARGDTVQPPMKVAGQQVAVNICYEDVFGEEIIAALPEATLLVNMTNDGWYGQSHAAAQHNQISQFRAMETGRMMLRATNTGVTSIIGVHGQVLQQLPQHEQAALHAMAQGFTGSTPYVRWGNWAVLLLMALMLSLPAWPWHRRSMPPVNPASS